MIKEKNILLVLVIFALTLIGFHTVYFYAGGADISYQIFRLFNPGYEANIPTWYSSILLFMVGYVCFEIYSIKRTVKGRTFVWGLLTALFIFMSCDEIAQIHETLGQMLYKYVFSTEIKAHSSWTVILGPVVALFLIVVAVITYKELGACQKTKRLIMSGFGLYLFGAFLLEGTLNFLNHEELQWVWNIENIFEELFEMLGILTLLVGFTKYRKELQLSVSK